MDNPLNPVNTPNVIVTQVFPRRGPLATHILKAGRMTTGAKKIWETSLGQLQLQVPRSSYDTWFKGTSGIALEGGSLTVAVPTTFAAEWLERRMYQLIQRTVEGVATSPLHVQFQVLSHAERGRPGVTDESGPTPQLTLENGTQHPASNGPSHRGVFNHRYTFDNFIIGTNNQLAHAAARSVAERPGEQYNPLFIYSGVGLGKTHLLHAIASAVAQQNLHPLYVTTEQFTNEFIQAIRERKTEDFRAKYRSADVLLLDDIQFLAGKEQTQEGFFHTFNDLHNSNRHIVVTCDRPPKSVSHLEDRLRSRFEWGLIADIQAPDLETRLAIIYAKAAAQQASLRAEVAESIARRSSHSIRELEGHLNRVLALAQFIEAEITVDLVDMALAVVAPATPAAAIPPQEAIAIVARQYSLNPADLCTRPRDRKTSHPQRIAMYILGSVLGLPSDVVASHLGNWNKRTISNSLKQISQQVKEDTALQQELGQLKAHLGLAPHG